MEGSEGIKNRARNYSLVFRGWSLDFWGGYKTSSWSYEGGDGRILWSIDVKVNLHKSKLFFAPKMSWRQTRAVSNICQIPMTSDLGKYLGVPIHHSRVTRGTYLHILEKVKMKLVEWKANMLSLVGRLTLIQTTTAAIPIYSMEMMKLPLGICDHTDRVNRTFLWGGTEEKRRLHFVS